MHDISFAATANKHTITCHIKLSAWVKTENHFDIKKQCSNFYIFFPHSLLFFFFCCCIKICHFHKYILNKYNNKHPILIFFSRTHTNTHKLKEVFRFFGHVRGVPFNYCFLFLFVNFIIFCCCFSF